MNLILGRKQCKHNIVFDFTHLLLSSLSKHLLHFSSLFSSTSFFYLLSSRLALVFFPPIQLFLYLIPWWQKWRRHLAIIAYMKPRVETGSLPCTHTAGGRAEWGNQCLDSCWYYRYHLIIKHWKWVRNDLREMLAGQRWRAGVNWNR